MPMSAKVGGPVCCCAALFCIRPEQITMALPTGPHRFPRLRLPRIVFHGRRLSWYLVAPKLHSSGVDRPTIGLRRGVGRAEGTPDSCAQGSSVGMGVCFHRESEYGHAPGGSFEHLSTDARSGGLAVRMAFGLSPSSSASSRCAGFARTCAPVIGVHLPPQGK